MQSTPKVAFVLDCSITMSWFYHDEGSRYTDSVRRSLKKQAAIVPVLWPFEVMNSLLQGIRRGRSTRDEVIKWLLLVKSLPIKYQPLSSTEMFDNVFAFANQYQLTSYDASYLYLALQLQLPIASLDDKVNQAATHLGVDRFDPENIL
jgi:predicted nucleic acid-binding protein